MSNSKSGHELSEDYYWENGFMVFTESYHLKRGYCCNSGCRHCPYGFNKGNNGRRKVTVSWSGGKDSAFALYKVLLSQEYEIVNLHTVIDESTKRVGLHGIHETLIEKQADCIGLPLKKIYLASSENHNVYTACMLEFYNHCAQQGIELVVFGDIFLEDLRNFRIDLLKPSKLSALFPLWKARSEMIVNDFLEKGFKTTVCAADASLFSEDQVGNIIDKDFLATLSPRVDPCGENGEFHTFVYDGPLFKSPVPIVKGEVVKKTYTYQKKNDSGILESVESDFWFQDFRLNDCL
jgi:uncharacterized protein (TIGR00290 family)